MAQHGTVRNDGRRTRKGGVAIAARAASPISAFGHPAGIASPFGLSLLLGLILGLAGLLRLIGP